MADEYINRIERFGYWKDTAAMFEGDAVQSFTMHVSSDVERHGAKAANPIRII